MIQTFADPETEAFFATGKSRKFQKEIQKRAAMRLSQLHAATSVEDLRSPPSNHLERLSGDRDEQWRIRVNDRWRVCFRFFEGNAYDVEIVDDH
ncbi:MAG: type II toxin-antitoxin system RelE/ParE family toxin [Zoogloeaceae bacterium]|jgi:proteic killer suppression protein|nr:type II toxin-antitoxin system RelE/ParE family toxin [Zoogloeaceae bacterium]